MGKSLNHGDSIFSILRDRNICGYIISGKMRIPHPIPYQGSKRGQARIILRYFPSEKTRLFEPFAGSAAISLVAAAHGSVSSIVLNDTNASLMDLWRNIIDSPEELISAYTRMWEEQAGREREYYNWARAQFNQTGRPDLFLFLLARCVKASVRYNANGEFNQSPDNRRRGSHPLTMGKHIREASRLLHGKTEILTGDFRNVIRQACERDIIYMDPPYQGVCGRRDSRYCQGISVEELIDSLETMNQRGLSYLLSYDGRTGDKAHGSRLPVWLKLVRLDVNAGPSTQATLLGRRSMTVESLYISKALVDRLGKRFPDASEQRDRPQLSLF